MVALGAELFLTKTQSLYSPVRDGHKQQMTRVGQRLQQLIL